MLDFTSALYLGFRHRATVLPAWGQLTSGVPAALAEPPVARAVAGQLACLQGCEATVTGASTLHLFWDLFAMLAEQKVAIFLDTGAYPIAGWAAAAAAARGVPVHRFGAAGPAGLARLVRGERKRRPVIVSDGLCSPCGCRVPVARYLEIVREAGGLLVLDDTQALGLLGQRPDHSEPYGHGGGGSLRYLALGGPDIILVSSLAKAFGVPLAALSGSRGLVAQFRATSKTRIHTSPPSFVSLLAGQRALALNETEGDRRRARLVQRVRQFRERLAAGGLTTRGGLFPMQSLQLPERLDARLFHQKLLAGGVRSVLREGCLGRPTVTFVLTARHARVAIDRAASIILHNYYQGQLDPKEDSHGLP